MCFIAKEAGSAKKQNVGPPMAEAKAESKKGAGQMPPLSANAMKDHNQAHEEQNTKLNQCMDAALKMLQKQDMANGQILVKRLGPINQTT